MKRLLFSLFVLGLVSAVISGLAGIMPGTQAQSGFTNDDLQGDYGLSFDGFATISTPSGPVQVPVAGVGRFTADGEGNQTDGVRILNFNGEVIQQTFTGTFSVNPDGTGSSTATFSGTPPVTETLAFVLIDGGREVQFMVTGSGIPDIDVVTRGVARLQD